MKPPYSSTGSEQGENRWGHGKLSRNNDQWKCIWHEAPKPKSLSDRAGAKPHRSKIYGSKAQHIWASARFRCSHPRRGPAVGTDAVSKECVDEIEQVTHGIAKINICMHAHHVHVERTHVHMHASVHITSIAHRSRCG